MADRPRCRIIDAVQIGVDGKTAYSRLKGKAFRRELVPFGECVHFVPVVTRNVRLNKLAAKWRDAIFLGIKESSGEYFVGTPDGVFRARSVKRKPDDEKYQRSLLESMKGVPWQLHPNSTADVVEPLPPQPAVQPRIPAPADDVPPADKELAAPIPRQLSIRRNVELERYGYTPGCPLCMAYERKGSTSFLQHSPACRSRIEAAMLADPQQQRRVERQRQWGLTAERYPFDISR